jgi:flagellar hook assembly protein FlgD
MLSLTRLEIFNILGQRVKTLVAGEQQAGPHEVSWNGTDEFDRPALSGVYLYRLTAGTFSSSKKILIIR